MCVVPAQKYTASAKISGIEIVIKDKSNFSPNFKKDEVLIKQLEYYKYYYDKYNESTRP